MRNRNKKIAIILSLSSSGLTGGSTGQSRQRRVLLDSVLRLDRRNKSGNDIWTATKRGFTLIEIVTALAILVIGLVSIMALFPVGFQASGRAADYTKAAIFAQDKMEEVKMKGFDNAKSETEEDAGNKEGKFTRKVTVADVPEYEGYLKEAIVTVGWKERGKNREKEFKTYIADYTP